MLNISDNTVNQEVEFSRFNSFKRTVLSNANRMFTRWLLFTLFLVIVFLFLPWTQNVQSKGKVTTLQPGQRPQTIQSTIAGRIEKWYVREGDLVRRGDTIVFLSEIKSEYFDPDLVPRTNQQVKAKEGAINSYSDKVVALEQQIEAMKSELEFKQRQLRNKILQTEAKLNSAEADYAQAIVQDSIAKRQFVRSQELFDKGIDSRTKVEDKQSKVQETENKVISARNKVQEALNELENARLALNTVQYEYNQKIAKAESDKFSTRSMMYDAESSVNKLRIQASSYEFRSQFYYIVAPQDCYITKAITPGIGETVKEGGDIVTIMPADYELAVELFVKPMDLPLIELGQEVRFIFDGWPAFIFSGWPGQSFGTYSGSVVAIDNMISKNGEYRILVGADPGGKPWPEALRVGSGAQGIALLNNVPLWYEIWRRLNGFPPDYYDAEDGDMGDGEDVKMKAPAKSIK
ncbi:MAG: HlyD family secretion protein [Phaeodactylibacter xiamenensis]|uniref:Biotin attachment protein n=1 Tax=Phaeodactylibacter xiamenensis TaxID=1524460 RepID=A0A098S5P0_9BACT|nr:biotin/lipoyl-binding protein [Phaeodactylibacter xiamenensis]KGE87425.1 biotin attachment protein [Phaeodactylibacter xiamenensis]MCR9051111.1 HlyD family secretion protein [bacterium]